MKRSHEAQELHEYGELIERWQTLAVFRRRDVDVRLLQAAIRRYEYSADWDENDVHKCIMEGMMEIM